MSKVASLCAQARALSDGYLVGGSSAFSSFQSLAQFLLSLTVMAEGEAVRLTRTHGGNPNQVLGGQRGPTSPVRLRDGRWLRVAVTLHLDDTGRDAKMKVSKSSFQYQQSEDGSGEIFRYDYLRVPGSDPHPQAHLNVHGALTHSPLPPSRTLARVHFPTGRVALEAVIRLLIEQFEVPSREPAEVWRPVLSVTEAAFAEIAHRPLSGPPS